MRKRQATAVALGMGMGMGMGGVPVEHFAAEVQVGSSMEKPRC